MNTPLTEDRFWAIVEDCHDFDFEVVLENLAKALAGLEPLQVLWFEYYYSVKFAAANTWPLRQFIGFVLVCTDDGFTDFKSWLIFRGRERYERAIKDPDTLSGDLRRYRNIFIEGGARPVVANAVEAVGVVEGDMPPEAIGVSELQGDYIEADDVANRFPIAQKEFREGESFNPWGASSNS